MGMTVAQHIAMIRQVADAQDTTRWPDAVVQTWLGVVHRQEWKNILNANNEYRMLQLPVTEDANGQFDKSALSSGSGDTLQTCYRILSLSDQQQFYYRQVRYQDYPAPQAATTLPYVWYENGTKIQMLPAVAGNVVTATFNVMPQRADLLSTDTVAVDFPDDYETLLDYAAAAHLAMKGGLETTQSLQYRAVADDIRNAMLLDLRRLSKDPTRFRAMDSSLDWGGV